MNDLIRIGSRGSQLALWQANHIADKLRALGHAVAIEIIRTSGDKMQQPEQTTGPKASSLLSLAPLADGKGIFIKEIEEALDEGRIDLAVHSLKDLPTQLDPRFMLAAIPPRADPRDAWVCETYWALHTLPTGGRIGTSSPRRRAQILALRPDVTFVELRGNIDTRLRRLAEGACDALVLASAGLDRLARTESVHRRFPIDELCPAPGQGALALEIRADDERIRAIVSTLDDSATRFSVEAERTTLDALGGGCQLPIGVYCAPIRDVADPTHSGAPIAWKIQAQVVAPDGERMICHASVIPAEITPAKIAARTLGLRVAADLKARGALELLAVSV
jgi:hydroxymethylbilane synthase